MGFEEIEFERLSYDQIKADFTELVEEALARYGYAGDIYTDEEPQQPDLSPAIIGGAVVELERPHAEGPIKQRSIIYNSAWKDDT